MTPNDVARVQDYLRRTFENDRIAIDLPSKRGAPVEVRVADEFIGVLHRDDEDDDGSWSLIITILDEDLPPASPVAPKPATRRK
jgi:hypothetical protein